MHWVKAKLVVQIRLLECTAEGRLRHAVFVGMRDDKRAAVIMSLIQSAKLNAHDPFRYLADILERLPTHPASRLEELLPHRWQGSKAANAN